MERLAAQLGFDVETCSGVHDTLDTLARGPVSLALVNVGTPEVDGPELLRRMRSTAPDCDVVFMGAPATADGAIDAIMLGAREYVTEPFDADRLRQVLNHRRGELARRAHIFALEAQLAEQTEFHGMIGRGPAMQEVFDWIQRLAPHARHVLISGETGTGKELAAHAFHEVGPRRAQAFVTVNCSTGAGGLFGGDLRAHVGGADWKRHGPDPFGTAEGGTWFLDEIGDLPAGLQATLLRVLERGEVERAGSADSPPAAVALVATSHRDLRADVASGRFCGRLFDRLNTVSLRLPPLRDRREDIPYLIAAFVSGGARRFRKSLDGVTTSAERLLLGGRWDGNVRELRNVIERACMRAEGRLISDRDLAGPRGATPDAEGRSSRAARFPDPRTAHLGDMEREHIVDALRQVSGNRMAAAKVLGISRRALYRRLARHQITDPAPRSRDRRF